MRRHTLRLDDWKTAVSCKILLLIALAPVLAPGGAPPLAGNDHAGVSIRFTGAEQLDAASAEWVTFDGGLGISGSATSITVVDARHEVRTSFRMQLKRPVTHGVLSMGDLYLVERSDGRSRLAVLTVGAAEAVPIPIELVPAPSGELHLARMDDYLLVAEDGYGLRLLRLPHLMPGDHAEQHGSHGLVQVAMTPLGEPVTAITASLRTIYLATGRGLILVDARVPSLAAVTRRIPMKPGIHALAANGPTLYAMTAEGLSLLSLEYDGSIRERRYPEVRGRSMYLAGRTIYLAGGEDGLVAVKDGSSTRATIFIQVGDFFFNPSGLVNVNQGDTVTWQKPSTSFPHNVFSCNPVQNGCSGASSTEVFSSGSVTTSPFVFSHTFTVVGNNPYLCQAHVFSMQGDIGVAAAAASPPGVADGRSGTTPMTVGKLTSDAADLRILYDPEACGSDADDHNIVFGDAADLPASLGGVYESAGAQCNIGTLSPFDWTTSPAAPTGNDFLWWLIVADDGAGKEGSWSEDSASGERIGPGVNGASNRCGNTDKDFSNGCPP